MSHLLTVDAHLGVAARLRYLDNGAELLPPSRSSSRPGCRQEDNGGPPGGAVSCDASESLYCLHPAGQTVPPLPGL